MWLNKVGEFVFEASQQKRLVISLRRIQESVFGIEAQAKTRESKHERSLFLTQALPATCHDWTGKSNHDRMLSVKIEPVVQKIGQSIRDVTQPSNERRTVEHVESNKCCGVHSRKYGSYYFTVMTVFLLCSDIHKQRQTHHAEICIMHKKNVFWNRIFSKIQTLENYV